jgi:hypothetical protein
MMEAICSSETPDCLWNTWCYNSEYYTPHSHHHVNIKTSLLLQLCHNSSGPQTSTLHRPCLRNSEQLYWYLSVLVQAWPVIWDVCLLTVTPTTLSTWCVFHFLNDLCGLPFDFSVLYIYFYSCHAPRALQRSWGQNCAWWNLRRRRYKNTTCKRQREYLSLRQSWTKPMSRSGCCRQSRVGVRIHTERVPYFAVYPSPLPFVQTCRPQNTTCKCFPRTTYSCLVAVFRRPHTLWYERTAAGESPVGSKEPAAQ